MALAVTAVGVCSPADAQSYYMRERLVGVPKTSPPKTSSPVTTPPVVDPTPTPTQVSTPASQPVAPVVTYSWSTGEWSKGCGSSVNQSRTVKCVASDGSTATSANCTQAKPSTTRVGSDYQSCTYQVHDHGASATCSNGKREHYYDCLRSDGTDGIYITTCSTTFKSNPVLEAC